jgi:molybdopterin-containing oxidoreductase family membrane subunit
MVTMRHLDLSAKVMLATGLLTSYGYINEAFFAWYSASEFEMYMMANRMTGPYAEVYWTILACNLAITQTLWFRRVRHTLWALWVVSIFVNIGMWLERYMIVITSLHRDYLPAAWGMFSATFWDWAFFLGTIGLFLMLMFLFIRFVPMISMSEMRELIHETHHDEHDAEDDHDRRIEASPTGSPYTDQETQS